MGASGRRFIRTETGSPGFRASADLIGSHLTADQPGTHLSLPGGETLSRQIARIITGAPRDGSSGLAWLADRGVVGPIP